MKTSDIISLKNMRPFGAEGRVCVEYTDPVTGRIKEQIRGNNHVFTDALFGMKHWDNALLNIPLFLSNNTDAVDETFPLMKGDMIGYGVPGEAASGTYKGSWNSAAGYRRQMTASGVSSKFVYDFSPSQVTEEVKKIGLTWQYTGYTAPPVYKPVYPAHLDTGYSDNTRLLFDGYMYTVASGVVTKTDILTGNVISYNISGIVGTSGGAIGINPHDGTCYVKVYSSTAANRKLYKFSDSTFSALSATYTISAFASSYNYVFGVYGNYLYDVFAGRSIDFVNDTDFMSFSITSDPVAQNFGLSSSVSRYNMSVIDKYMFSSSSSSNYATFIFDLEKGWQTGCAVVPKTGVNFRISRHPAIPADKAFYHVALHSSQDSCINPAIAIYRLPPDAPERPAGYGMTVTYELEILY